MLNYLRITNFALIEAAEIELGEGFNVFTGESGAGKTILMSAMALLSGNRAAKGIIRTGCDKCTISGIFKIEPAILPEISRLMRENDLDFDEEAGELTIRRVITRSATRNYLNDVPVGAKLLATVGEHLIDLHGANEQISLMVPARQLALLDNYGDLNSLKERCRTLYRQLQELREEEERFAGNLPDEAEADRLSLISEEISGVNPHPGEDEELSAKQRLGANARQVIETLNSAVNALTEGENSLADQLGTVYHQLAEVGRIDEHLTGCLPELCSGLQDGINDLSRQLSALTERVELDPETLNAIEMRLGELFTLKRRYGPTLEQVFDTLNRTEERLNCFRAAAAKRAEFKQRRQELQQELRTAAEELSVKRHQEAVEFLRKAGEKLSVIGFEKAELKAEFQKTEPDANGIDHLELLFSANEGEELRPLRKIASSGELSRVMLALKTVLADADAVPTVIFDEIDMNIGGETANKVAAELHDLGRKRQIICISHLAQVAVRGDRHYRVSKYSENGRTVSEVKLLQNPVPEIARMLGGGASALAHAENLIKAAK